ncbi:Malonyl CoA-acyl carrier protein transacylase [Fusarium oxysporum f. sp. albedinis]|nr:Malonyl CoA-acyl carrier protein transacylase [Fusarium oxysporum f. sp. albedinis]
MGNGSESVVFWNPSRLWRVLPLYCEWMSRRESRIQSLCDATENQVQRSPPLPGSLGFLLSHFSALSQRLHNQNY